MMMTSAAAFLAGAVLLGAPVPQDPPPAQVETIAPAADLDALTLVMSGTGHAVVRFGSSEAGAGLLIVKPGDRIGRTAATVREIDPGRLVLDELTRDKEGRPHRAQIVLREGEPGGRRYMRDPGLDAPTGVRPDVLGRGGKPTGVKKPGKHP
jgi:hypothetical protein